MKVIYGVCVGSWDRFNQYVAPRTSGRTVITVSGQEAIAPAYETIRLSAKEQDADVLILQHDDLELTDPEGELKLVEAIRSGVTLVGVAGGASLHGIGWWGQSPVGHQQTDAMMIDFGSRSGGVMCLEGSILAMSRWAINELQFDQNYPGFHGYDADFSMQVYKSGRRVEVVDVDTWHHNPMGFKGQQGHMDWVECDKIFRAKWGL